MKHQILRSTAMAVALTVGAGSAAFAQAEEITITVWAGGTNEVDLYRIENIEIAADILEREYAILGRDINITIEGKSDFGGWEEFKQGVTLAAEAGTAPNIVVTSHLDIAPWSQAGYIVPVEDYLDFDTWPLNDIYPNLLEIAAYNGVQWGIPQDAESRPFFYWKPTLTGLGWSDAEIESLPDRVAAGEYTLNDMLDDAQKAVDMGLVDEGYGFYPRVSNGPDYAQFYQSFGGVLEDPDSGKLVLDKQAMLDMYQFFVDAVDRKVTRKNHIGTDWGQWYSEVANGKAAFWHGGTWHFARYTGAEGNDDFFGTIQFSLIPAGNENGRANTITHPLVYLVTDQAEDDMEDIAAQLIKIASAPRLNALHAIRSAHLGISRQMSNIELYSNDRWASEATDRLLASANAQPNNLQYGIFSEAMFAGLESAWTGVKTPADAVADLEAELIAKIGDGLIIR